MISKISDFKLAESIIKSLCKENNCSFMDIEISFDQEGQGSLYIGETQNIAHTLYKIIGEYIQHSEQILGNVLFTDKNKERDFLLGIASYLRSLVYEDGVFSDYLEEFYRQKLYQKPFIWIFMKDIVCPVFDVPLQNIDVVSGTNSHIDIARFYTKEELKEQGKDSDSFIFINTIDNECVQNVFILLETLKAYELSPVDIIKDIYESDLYDKFYGLLKLAFKSEKKLLEFNNVLLNVLGVSFEHKNKGYLGKFAQTFYPETSSQWWYLGLTERLLESMRGSDWSTYYNLSSYWKDFWDNIEKIRRQKKAKGGEFTQLPFDKLLELKALQTVDYKSDPNITLQGVLSSQRIW